MKPYLLFLCFMISFGQEREGDFPNEEEEGTINIHHALETLDPPGDMDNPSLTNTRELGLTWPYVGDRCCNLSSTPKCLKRGGECIPRNDTCIGDVYIGPSYCNFNKLKSCKCCVPAECKTLSPCLAMNGTCDVACEGRSVSGKDFCKEDKFCKCCLPDDHIPEPCPCGQDLNGGCKGYSLSGRPTPGICMKDCTPETVQLNQHTCNQTGGENCNCCAPMSMDCGPVCNGPFVQSCTCIEMGATCPDEHCSADFKFDGDTADAIGSDIFDVIGIDAGTCYVHENGSHNIGCICCRDGLNTDCSSISGRCSEPGDVCIDKYSSPCPDGYSKVIDACHKTNTNEDLYGPPCDCCKNLACTSYQGQCNDDGDFCIDIEETCPRGYEEIEKGCTKPIILNGTLVNQVACKCCKLLDTECPEGCFPIGSQCFMASKTSADYMLTSGFCVPGPGSVTHGLAVPQDIFALSKYLDENYEEEETYWLGGNGNLDGIATWYTGEVIGPEAPWFADDDRICNYPTYGIYLQANAGCYSYDEEVGLGHECLGCSTTKITKRTTLCSCDPPRP